MNAYLPLIISNAVTLVFAILEDWSLPYLFWIYWFQSVSIGIFHFLTILELKNFSTANMKYNGQVVEPNEKAKRPVAFFFLFHYGFFHFIYAIFLFAFTSISGKRGEGSSIPFFGGSGKWLFFLTAAVFFVSGLYDFIKNRGKMKKDVNLGTLLFFPYARIIPMHLCIILAFFFSTSATASEIPPTPRMLLILFMLLKTVADLVMQFVENNKLRDFRNDST